MTSERRTPFRTLNVPLGSSSLSWFWGPPSFLLMPSRRGRGERGLIRPPPSSCGHRCPEERVSPRPAPSLQTDQDLGLLRPTPEVCRRRPLWGGGRVSAVAPPTQDPSLGSVGLCCTLKPRHTEMNHEQCPLPSYEAAGLWESLPPLVSGHGLGLLPLPTASGLSTSLEKEFYLLRHRGGPGRPRCTATHRSLSPLPDRVVFSIPPDESQSHPQQAGPSGLVHPGRA